MRPALRIAALLPALLCAARAEDLPVETYEETLARMPAWLAERAPRAAAKAFSVDPARVRCLDLAPFANRSSGDTVAGDGKGGWTDQGENHLRHAPWGPTDCNGVPFDFIRPDQNDDRACVMLRSKHLPDLPDAVRGIAAGCKAEALYFLHAGAWVEKDAEGFRYVVHYADGASETAPMVGGVDFGDWWIDTRRAGLARTTRYHTGWANSESKGFHVLRWENPHPEKTIATIDIESACGETIPIIEAITAELPDESPFALRRLKLRGWGGAKPERHDGALEIVLPDASRDWCGANLDLPGPAPFPGEDPAACDLVFEANGGRTPLGVVGPGGQRFQVAARFRLQDGAETSGPYVHPTIEGDRIDEDPATWQTVRLPVRLLLPKNAPSPVSSLSGLNLQYRMLSSDRAALRVRSIRLEPSAAR